MNILEYSHTLLLTAKASIKVFIFIMSCEICQYYPYFIVEETEVYIAGLMP